MTGSDERVREGVCATPHTKHNVKAKIVGYAHAECAFINVYDSLEISLVSYLHLDEPRCGAHALVEALHRGGRALASGNGAAPAPL